MHEAAFREWGAVPEEILYDRMKTVWLGSDECTEPSDSFGVISSSPLPMHGLLWPIYGLIAHGRLAFQPLGEFQVAWVLALGGEQVGVVVLQCSGNQQDVVI
jgi:hypothetical protein